MQFKTLPKTHGDNLVPDDTMTPVVSPKITSDTKPVTVSPQQNHHDTSKTMPQNDTKRHTVRIGSKAFSVLKIVSQQYGCSLKKAFDLMTECYVTSGDSPTGR